MKKFINNNTHFIQQKGIGKYLNTFMYIFLIPPIKLTIQIFETIFSILTITYFKVTLKMVVRQNGIIRF